ncbi:MAG TPA: heavy-metal-associated domain-containing protein [Luteibaculaceae bacterium]|nr:heavy-metal-associated domain-containing protein [Luteibaculaceae bacterium]
MKTFILFLSLFVSGSLLAQEKPTVITEKFQVSGVCDMCKTRIEKAAMYTKGVKKADWNPETGLIEVVYHTGKTNRNAIEQNIAKAGYDTEGAKADAKAYDALPHCCQYKSNEKH